MVVAYGLRRSLNIQKVLSKSLLKCCVCVFSSPCFKSTVNSLSFISFCLQNAVTNGLEWSQRNLNVSDFLKVSWNAVVYALRKFTHCKFLGGFTVVVVCCVSSITVRNSQFLGNLSYMPLLLLLMFDRCKIFPVSRRSYHYLTPW